MRGVRCSGNLPAAMTGHDLLHDFILHERRARSRAARS